MNGVKNFGQLRIWWGNEDAPTGGPISFYVTILWGWGLKTRTLFSTYTGG